MATFQAPGHRCPTESLLSWVWPSGFSRHQTLGRMGVMAKFHMEWGRYHQEKFREIYALVNVYITMERSTMLFMGKSTMAIFNSYACLPEGTHHDCEARGGLVENGIKGYIPKLHSMGTSGWFTIDDLGQLGSIPWTRPENQWLSHRFSRLSNRNRAQNCIRNSSVNPNKWFVMICLANLRSLIS